LAPLAWIRAPWERREGHASSPRPAHHAGEAVGFGWPAPGLAATVRGRPDWRSWAARTEEDLGSGGRTTERLRTDGTDQRLASHVDGAEGLEP
jgi:hypothetical protein